MESLGKRPPESRQPGSPLMRHLRRLFSTPADPDIAPNIAPAPQVFDQWPADLRVLVVDDNPLNLMVASEMLGYFGIRALLAADGAEAVAVTAAIRLDLILMDLQMPVLDGLGASRQIRRFELETLRARVPVVAYTSVSGSRTQLAAHGIDDLLAKPCDIPAMRECLLRWCPLQGVVAQPPEAAAHRRQ